MTKKASQPKQERSRRTLERTLAAVEELLTRKDFEAISVEEIVAAAKSSVGSFYARFGSKDGLLPHLYERYDRDLERLVEGFIASGEWASRTLTEQARWYAEMHVKIYRERRWLMRAVGFYARRMPSPLPESLHRSRQSLHARIVDTFAPHLDQLPGGEARKRVETALYFISAVCRDKILFSGPHAQVTQVDDAKLVEELTEMFVRYVGGHE